MFSGQPSSLPVGDEELTSVGVRSRIGHRELHFSSEGHIEVLIGEFTAVDGHATGAVAAGKVATLRHKTRDDSVELASLVVALFTVRPSAETSEVFSCFGDLGVEQLEDDAPFFESFFTFFTNFDIEESLLVFLIKCRKRIEFGRLLEIIFVFVNTT